MKYLILIFITFTFLFASNSDDFDKRQQQILLLKQIIKEEEFIAKAYEEYILNTLTVPIRLDQLQTDEYLGSSFALSFFDDPKSFVFWNRRTRMTNRLTGSDIENDDFIKRLYESDTFRQKTFYVSSSVLGFYLEDDFAKHIYYLNSTLNDDLLPCSDISSKRYCIKNEHIYLYATDDTLLMHYHKDKFKTGPIIITSDRSYHDYVEFESLSKGTVLYDDAGQKYIKTLDGIKRLR